MSVGAPDFPGVVAALREARAGHPRHLDRIVRVVRRAQRAPAVVLSQGLHAATLCADVLAPWGPPTTPLAGREAALRRAAAATDPAPYDRATVVGNGFAQTCLRWPPTPAPAPPRSGDLPPVPTLLLAGDHDLSTPLPWAREQAAHTPQGKLVVVRGAGHSVQSRSPAPPAGAPWSASCWARLGPVLERYTADGRQAILLAHQEAQALRSGAIGTGHLLLGVLGTIALLVPLSAHDVRVAIGVGDGPGDGELPFTDAAKRALEAAPHEAERLGHELRGARSPPARAGRRPRGRGAQRPGPGAPARRGAAAPDPPAPALRPRPRRARRRPGHRVARRPRAADRRPRPSARRRPPAAGHARPRWCRRRRSCASTVSTRPPFVVRSAGHEGRRRRSSPTLREALGPWRRGPKTRW